jgi:hypothetical protein
MRDPGGPTHTPAVSARRLPAFCWQYRYGFPIEVDGRMSPGRHVTRTGHPDHVGLAIRLRRIRLGIDSRITQAGWLHASA